MANIKVAVRVRPISARELNLTGSEVVVHTDTNEISLTNLKVSSSKAGDSRARTRKYGFDYCFDSSDPGSPSFADQARIYHTLGRSVLDALFTGYNSCLVAYGQTASGKTYTMMGTKEDPGLTPRLCEGLFARIEEESKNESNYVVSVSYLEIYNERVRDLLKPSSSTGGLRVREHPRLGPYVQGLTHHLVRTLESLMSYVEEGTKARKTASTLQNSCSSRSHALLTIGVAEASQGVGNGVSSRRKEILPRGGSKLRLVDLAGSESAATCSGVHRLKEGANINKSLVALGNVISALAERGTTGSGPGRRFIPYRDSSLTWLLKDALGGNATTIMLATISPASGSYNETAHTLRFAQRAQSVVNRPVVNEDPVARIIRELRAEVARLRSMLLEKNPEPDSKSLCSCQRNQADANKDRSSQEEVATGSSDRLDEQKSKEESQEQRVESLEERKGPKSVVPLRKSNSSDSVTTYEVDSSVKKFGSLEFLATSNRFAGSYNRAKVTELNDEEDEVSEIHESVFVDIPTLVAVLIKPDYNLQESSAQIEEICSDEVVEESIDAEFIEASNDQETYDESEKPDSIDHDERSSSVNSCHAFGDNEADVYQTLECPRAKSCFKPREKPKFRKQDSVDALPTSILSNLHTSKKFGSVETIQKKKDPVFFLRRSHTSLEKQSTVPDRTTKLNNIREIEDQKTSTRSNWSKEQFQRKGSNDSDKSFRESNNQVGSKIKSYPGKHSLENLKRKTSKDSSSSSSKDEQILISSLARDKLFRRKSSLEQEPPSNKNHTPIQRAKRAEIVAAVTERLYSSKKSAEDIMGLRSPPDTGDTKSMAKMKLQEISRKMLGKRRRVCVDTQTDCSRTVRMKDTASLTETPRIVCQDVGILTDQHEMCEYIVDRKTSVLRVKEIATSTERPKTNVVRCKDVGTLANDLEEYDYEIHSPRNDSGILSDDTQNYAESNLSSTEVSDLCQEADRRVAYAESSTNTSMFSSCRSFAVQTPRPEVYDRSVSESKAPACVRQCCNSSQELQNHPPSNNIEKSVISISLPDTISITIESTNSLESRIVVMDNDPSRRGPKRITKDETAQTEEWDDLRNEIFCSRDQTTSTLGQTDSRVFRIENIFQDPNNATKNLRVDSNRTEGTRIRNSITFRNSLGTSYVSQPKKHDVAPERPGAEGFIRDGLITEAFINRKSSFNSRRAPSSAVYQDPWRNWQVPVSLANTVHPIDYAKGLGFIPPSWQPEIGELSMPGQSFPRSNCVRPSGSTFGHFQVDPGLTNVPESSEMKSPYSTISSNLDYDHGFSDDSLDYNENSMPNESATMAMIKQAMKQREILCPPDVVAHTKRDRAKSSINPEKSDSISDFEDVQVEFPRKSPTKLTDAVNVHDYKSLILGRPFYSFEETNDELAASLSRLNDPGKKKVSFCNSDIHEKKLDVGSPGTLKSIIKNMQKKNVSEFLNSSNDETDDSQQEERICLTLEKEWKAEMQSASSEEGKEDQDSVESEGNCRQSRKKVKFSVDELSENTCSESDSCEMVDEEDEEEEDLLDGRNVLEEYLSEAVTFMRNLNSISEYVNGTSMLERYPASLSRGRGGKRGARRRSRSSSSNRDYSELVGRRVSLKDDDDYPTEDDDIAVSTDSYDRCLKGIQRLEDCIRRVDRHNELLKEKYGIDCESAGARPGLASPSIDTRAPVTNQDLRIPRETETPSEDTSLKANDDLEKKIFDQLMSVANSIRYRHSSKLQARLLDSSDCGSRSPSYGSKFREKYRHNAKEPFYRDVRGSLSLEEASDANEEHEDFTTYEITGNLSVGRSCSPEKSHSELLSPLEDEFLPVRRFNRSSWSADINRATWRTPKHDELLSKYEVTDCRIADNADPLGRMYNAKGCLPTQRVLTGNSRRRLQETEDYSRRTRDGCCRVCASCSKDQSDIESTSSEIVHLRDKLKYPGSPRARFLELLRERRRIVECSRGTSAS
ncbi:PREDICTED: kinesin-like protein KIN-7I [Eufriesea mexicana]|uniref:kinesin-like protein KIN-7I n=1 Tax=Eufriesea mexicana TaxID=516756 RepID=UPI00083C6155|nr:PREDICTED: kinesin-like protein KIN-7I [Eufriesea mexicana]